MNLCCEDTANRREAHRQWRLQCSTKANDAGRVGALTGASWPMAYGLFLARLMHFPLKKSGICALTEIEQAYERNQELNQIHLWANDKQAQAPNRITPGAWRRDRACAHVCHCFLCICFDSKYNDMRALDVNSSISSSSMSASSLPKRLPNRKKSKETRAKCFQSRFSSAFSYVTHKGLLGNFRKGIRQSALESTRLISLNFSICLITPGALRLPNLMTPKRSSSRRL